MFATRETRRTIVLVSTSGGSGGDAGRARTSLGHTCQGPFDAAIVLGDLAGAARAQAVRGALLRRPRRGPAAAAAHGRRSDRPGGRRRTRCARARSASSPTSRSRSPRANRARSTPRACRRCSCRSAANAARRPREAVSAERLEGFGRAVLSAVDALDAAPDVSHALQTGVLLQHKTIPAWAVRLLVLDAAARTAAARRRRARAPAPPPRAGRALDAVDARLRAAVPAVRAVRLSARWLGIVGAAPADARLAGALPFDGAAATAVAAVVLAFALGLAVVAGARAAAGLRRAPDSEAAGPGDAARAARRLLSSWAATRSRALLLLPALHLWLVSPRRELRPRPPARARRWWRSALLPLLLLVVFYAHQLGLGPARSPGSACCSSPAATSGCRARSCGASRSAASPPPHARADARGRARRAAGGRRDRGHDPRAAAPTPARVARRDRVGSATIAPAPLSSAEPASIGRSATARNARMAESRREPAPPTASSARAAARRRPRSAAARCACWRSLLIALGVLVLLDAGGHARLAGADHGAVRHAQPGPPQRRAAHASNAPRPRRRSDDAREPARRAHADRVPGRRARTPHAQRRRGGAHRDPAIDASYVVVKGTDTEDSRAGPASTRKRSFPGVAGTTAIAGHRTTYLAPFRHIDLLKPGQPHRAEHALRALHLHASPASGWSWPDDVALRSPRSATRRLVLSACTPLFSAEKRLLVFARLTRTVPVGAARVLPAARCRSRSKRRRPRWRRRAPRRCYQRCSNPSIRTASPRSSEQRHAGRALEHLADPADRTSPSSRDRRRSTRARSRGRGAEAQLVVFAARRRQPPGGDAQLGGDLRPRRRRAAARRARRAGATPLARADVPGVGREPVGEVDHRVHARRRQRAALAQPRHRARHAPAPPPPRRARGTALQHRQRRRPRRPGGR